MRKAIKKDLKNVWSIILIIVLLPILIIALFILWVIKRHEDNKNN